MTSRSHRKRKQGYEERCWRLLDVRFWVGGGGWGAGRGAYIRENGLDDIEVGGLCTLMGMSKKNGMQNRDVHGRLGAGARR